MYLETISTPRGNLKEFMSKNDIHEMVYKLGHEISSFYHNKDIVMIGIMRGCLPFMIDLSREIRGCFPHIDYIGITSYEDNKSSGDARVYMEPKIPLEDMDVVLVDTIVGSGLSMRLAKQMILSQSPKSLSTCCLINNKSSNFSTTFKGYCLEKEHFLVGYGLDLDNDYRHLDRIFQLHP